MITPFGLLPNRLARDMSLVEQHEWLQTRISRRAVLAAGAGLGLVALGPRAAAAAAPGLIGRQVVYGPDPATDLTIAFALTSAFRVASVRVSGGGDTSEHAATVAMVPGSAARYARATCTGLRPDAAHRYEIVVDGHRVSTGSVRTARLGPHRFRITAFGDQGTGSASTAMLGLVRVLGPSVHLFAGDLCYADQSGMGGPGDVFKPRFWDVWIKQNDPVASHVPWMCVPGNHEMEPGFGMHGYAGLLARVPIGGASPLAVPVATTFRIGSVGFVGLDSNDVAYEIPSNRGWTGGAQTAWLDRTLAAMRAPGSGIDFVVAFLHASPYSTDEAHASEGGIRQAWVPLFDRYQVDLVISGHNHCYERTLPIRGGVPVAVVAAQVDSTRGTTYLTAGGGGAATSSYAFIGPPLTRVSDQDGHHNAPAPWRLTSAQHNGHSVVCIDVVPAVRPGLETTLQLRGLDEHGTVFDSVALVRTATVGAPDSTGDELSDSWPWIGAGALVTAAASGTAAFVLRRRSSGFAASTTGQTSKHDDSSS